MGGRKRKRDVEKKVMLASLHLLAIIVHLWSASRLLWLYSCRGKARWRDSGVGSVMASGGHIHTLSSTAY
jgi:hypothetical protein